MLDVNPPFLLICASLFAVTAGTFIRILQWRKGKAATAPILSGLASIPKRYLVDIHLIVMRVPFIAYMHTIAAGSLILMTALMIIIHGFWASWLLSWFLIGSASFLLIGVGMIIIRRIWNKTHLSQGAFQHIPFGLAALSIFSFGTTLPITSLVGKIDYTQPMGIILLLIGAYGCFEIFGGMMGGPMKHSIIGSLNLAFHPRPERFTSQSPATALKPLDLSAEKLGCETITDFKWNELLNFDACVECGHCENVCPAFEAKQPLNPKALIQNLVKAQSPLIHFKYTGNNHPDIASRDTQILHEQLVSNDTIWACTTCRACVEACPMMIEHVDAIVSLRRFQVLEAGSIPEKAAKVLDNLRLTDNRSGVSPAELQYWNSGTSLPIPNEDTPYEVLLWCGASQLELRSQHVLRALIILFKKANVTFITLGEEELDSGDIARRLGDEATYHRLARKNISTLSKYNFDRIVTPDPHDYNILKNEYPALGHHFNVAHHTEFLLDLIENGRLKVSNISSRKKTTYHDPCYLARYNGLTHAPRKLLQLIGVPITEMERNGRQTFCCGGGGGTPFLDIGGTKRIPDIRMEEARNSGAERLLVSCPGCMSMLEGVIEPRPEVMDIVELVLEAAGAEI